jgi:diacylglycerol kinase (ATP)
MVSPDYRECTDVFFVINPQAGTNRSEEMVTLIEEAMRTRQAHYAVHLVSPRERIDKVVDGALREGYTKIVAVGGDGTVSAVAGALATKEAFLGIIPAGTANMMARELGIPLRVNEACNLLSEGVTTTIDAMEVNGRHYVYQIVLGSTSQVMARIGNEEKQLLGRSMFVLAGLRLLVEYRPIYVNGTVDGEKICTWASQITIANAGILGLKPFRLGPDISPSDGKIEVIIMMGRTRIGFLGSGLDIVTKNYRTSRGLRYFDARQFVELDSDPPTLVKADGEIIGGTPVTLRVVPSAVKVMVPQFRKEKAPRGRFELP